MSKPCDCLTNKVYVCGRSDTEHELDALREKADAMARALEKIAEEGSADFDSNDMAACAWAALKAYKEAK